MPYLVEGLGDVKCYGTCFLALPKGVGPALNHGHEHIERRVATTEAELVEIEERGKVKLEHVGNDRLEDLAEDREQGDGAIVPGSLLDFFL